MLRTVLAAGVLALFAAQPVFAQDAMKPMKCDEASMMMVQQEMDKMTDESMKMQKDEAMKAMDMAKESMAANKTEECVMHLDEASKAMMKK